MISSILTFEVNLILGSSLTLWSPNALFLGSRVDVIEQFLFSKFPSILTFDFDLILGSFFTFWGPNGLFLGLG